MDGWEWSVSCPLALSRGPRSRYSLNGSLLGSRAGPDVWEERIIFRPFRESNSSRSSIPHPNHYVNWAILAAPFLKCFLVNKWINVILPKKKCNYRTGSERVNLKPSRSCWEPASASTSQVMSCEKHLCLYPLSLFLIQVFDYLPALRSQQCAGTCLGWLQSIAASRCCFVSELFVTSNYRLFSHAGGYVRQTPNLQRILV